MYLKIKRAKTAQAAPVGTAAANVVVTRTMCWKICAMEKMSGEPSKGHNDDDVNEAAVSSVMLVRW